MGEYVETLVRKPRHDLVTKFNIPFQIHYEKWHMGIAAFINFLKYNI